jgi:uncharacterized protein YbjT (DUF2867 family)
MTALMITGATGFIGGILLDLALNDARVSRIVAPTRRSLAVRPKLNNPIIDFEKLDRDAPWWDVDAVISALGTIGYAADAYQRTEVDYPREVARLTAARGARSFVYLSSVNASPQSRLTYFKAKGRAEQALQTVGIASLTFVRPAGIIQPASVRGVGNRVWLALFQMLGPVLSPRWRTVTGRQVAQALLDAALAAVPGVHIIESEALQHLPKR